MRRGQHPCGTQYWRHTFRSGSASRVLTAVCVAGRCRHVIGEIRRGQRSLTMSLVDAAQVASAIAACGALIAAVVQVRGLRTDARERRVGEILGVAVDTHVVTRPVRADRPGGRSLWEY